MTSTIDKGYHHDHIWRTKLKTVGHTTMYWLVLNLCRKSCGEVLQCRLNNLMQGGYYIRIQEMLQIKKKCIIAHKTYARVS